MTQIGTLRFARVLYPLGAYFMLVPIVDVLARAIPPSLGNPAWRYALVGLTFTNLGTFLMGAIIVGLIAFVQGNHILLRVLSVVSALGVVILLAGLGSFTLDGIQLRSVVRGAQKAFFAKAAVTAGLSGVLGVLAMLGLAVGSWRAARVVKQLVTQKAAASPKAAVPVYSTLSGGLSK